MSAGASSPSSVAVAAGMVFFVTSSRGPSFLAASGPPARASGNSVPLAT